MSEALFPPMEACGNQIRTRREANGTGGWHVAEVAVTHIEGEATRRARLFAASPRILAALQLLLTEAEGFSVSGVYFNESREAREAIAAAWDAIEAALEG